MLNSHRPIQSQTLGAQQQQQQHQQQSQQLIESNGNSNGYFSFDELSSSLQDRAGSDQISPSSSSVISNLSQMGGNTQSNQNLMHQHSQQEQQLRFQQYQQQQQLRQQQPFLQKQQQLFQGGSYKKDPQLPHIHNIFSTNTYFDEDTSYHFKTLVPAVAAGAIIGKGGETIAALQKDTGARVKMSKSRDFYPGTMERVCLITGSVDAILTILEFIMDKIHEKPDLSIKLSEPEAKAVQERDKQVKILVPNSTAGMIIGKAGAYIKQIKEESGSYVQISQKPKDITLQERCITIIGDKENNKIACRLILAKIVEDPLSGTCLNVSYADVNGPVANFNPTGSPYATNQNAISSSTASLNSALSTAVTNPSGLLVNGTGISLSLNLGAPNPGANQITSQLLENIKIALRGSGYTEPATNEVCTALSILAKYGVLGVGVGLTHTNGAHGAPLSYHGVNSLEQPSYTASGLLSTIGQVNLESYIGAASPTPRTTLDRFESPIDAFLHAASGTQAATPITLNNNTFTLATSGSAAQALGAAAAQQLSALSKSPTPGDLGSKDTKNVEIPEVIVGAILGPSGRSLVEIQNISGTIIQISKKGIFAPGTRNRIVTITGAPNSIKMAHFLIEQKINEEENKRARQNTITGLIQ